MQRTFIKFTSTSAGLLALIFLLNLARIKTLGVNLLLVIGGVGVILLVGIVSYIGYCATSN